MKETTAWVSGLGIILGAITICVWINVSQDTRLAIEQTKAAKEAIIATNDPIGVACALVPMTAETCRDYLDKHNPNR